MAVSDFQAVESGKETIVHAKDWAGEDDPANPRNYSLTRKVISTLVYTFLAMVSTMAASLYTPGTDDIKIEFGCSQEVAILPLSLYNLGMAFGPLLGSPLSETAGRKVVLLVTTPLFALFTMGAGLSYSPAGLSICRFFAGACAAPAISNASATITDYTAGRYRAVTMGFYYTIPTFGAVVGPLIGGFIVQGKGWRWTQWTTIFFILALYLPFLFTKETYKKTILQRRAKELGVEGPPTLQLTVWQTIRYYATRLFLRPAHMLFTEPIVSFVCLYSGFQFGLLYTFITASPWVYQHYYAFDLTEQSLSFLGLCVGTISATIPLILVDHLVYQPKWKAFGETHSADVRFQPEHRLYPAMIASPLLPVFLVVFAWTAHYRIHWACPIVFQGLTMTSSVMIYSSTNTYMMDAYGPLYGASAAAASMLSRYTFSTIFPFFALRMYRALGVGWATSLLAFCTVMMAPIPWLFFQSGERIRSRTKYETST